MKMGQCRGDYVWLYIPHRKAAYRDIKKSITLSRVIKVGKGVKITEKVVDPSYQRYVYGETV